MTHFDDLSELVINPERCLILGDVHVPYHDKKALEAALMYGLSKNVDTIILNGDLIDFHALSKFEKDPRLRSVHEEFYALLNILSIIRENFPDTRIIWKLGNHCIRWVKYITAKCPELYDFSFVSLENLIDSECNYSGIENPNIEVIEEPRVLNVQGWAIVHGHELKVGSMMYPPRS